MLVNSLSCCPQRTDFTGRKRHSRRDRQAFSEIIRTSVKPATLTLVNLNPSGGTATDFPKCHCLHGAQDGVCEDSRPEFEALCGAAKTHCRSQGCLCAERGRFYNRHLFERGECISRPSSMVGLQYRTLKAMLPQLVPRRYVQQGHTFLLRSGGGGASGLMDCFHMHSMLYLPYHRDAVLAKRPASAETSAAQDQAGLAPRRAFCGLGRQ